MSEEHKGHLIAGLVGERVELYQTSATFYHHVRALADLLPLWMDGIAARAEEMDIELETMKRKLETLPPLDLATSEELE